MDRPYGSDVPLAISSFLLRRLEETTRPCVRMLIEGTSTSVGAPPAWLERASDVRTLGFSSSNGRSVLHVKAPTLGDAIPEFFSQGKLWPGPSLQEDTALQLVSRVTSIVRNKEMGSDLYDVPLLRRFGHWSRLFDRGLSAVLLPITSSVETGAGVLDGEVVKGARVLSDETPLPRQVRLVGKLDMVRYSTRAFALKLESGQEIKGILSDGEPQTLQDYFGREVTLFGKAIYRPSGSLLRVDASEIVGTVSGRSAFSTVPPPLRAFPKVERRTKGARTGVEAFFGTWPGDETDEELLAALSDLRH